MAAPLRHLNRSQGHWPAWLLGLLVVLPLGWVSWAATAQGLDMTAWHSLFDDPQSVPAALLSLWTGLLSTALAVGLSAWLLAGSFPGPAWNRLLRLLSPMLAVPHASFAIGLLFLIAPSGWLLRLLSPWATGLEEPPSWPTSQDPWGLGLVLVLVAKEVPFLLWTAAGQLQRPELARRWAQELQLAASMGYSSRHAWWRVLWPQLWPRMWGPLLAVLAYGLTVVDMALLVGPASPPTLSVLAWTWLNDADPAWQRQGVAAAWLLALVMALTAAGLWTLAGLARWRHRWSAGDRGAQRRTTRATGRMPPAAYLLLVLYLAVMMALLLGSIAGVWPFPSLWPHSFSLEAWTSVVASADTVWTSLLLALGASAAALLWSLAWLEWAPRAWDDAMRRLLYLPLLLPSVLWVAGLHGLTLHWGMDAHWSGLWLAHALACLPYVLLTLGPAYLGFDARHAQLTASLGHGRWTLLTRVKWPLLKASIASSFAVGFAVSVAQYLPTLYVGGGRFPTVTTEAVALASGGQRAISAAYAWLQWVLPVLVFALAAWAGRARRFRHRGRGMP